MAKTPNNHRKPVSNSDVSRIKKLARGNTPTGLISHKLQRTVNSVRSIASKNGITLKPTNRSPYNRRKK